MEISFNTVRCVVCGYKWIPRVKKPKRCPKCQSYYWKSTTQIVKEVNSREQK